MTGNPAMDSKAPGCDAGMIPETSVGCRQKVSRSEINQSSSPSRVKPPTAGIIPANLIPRGPGVDRRRSARPNSGTMIEERCLKEIRERERRGEPLNLSAIQVECPHLLEGLFDPADFRGWRETLEAAGVAIDRMVVSPLVEVECLHCGYRAAHLSKHLAHDHEQTAAEYRREFRAGETQSEELRAERMGQRHGRPARIVMPHWEPAWSELYALDRLHYCHLRGHPANRAYWTKNEPGLEGYLRRLFVHWEPVLEAIGLDPDRERAARKIVTYDDRAEIRRQLRGLFATHPEALRLASVATTRHRSLLRSAILVYGSFEEALEDAGIEPTTVMPELNAPAERNKRRRLLAECRRWIREVGSRDELRLAALFEEFDDTVRAFYGTWRTLIALLGSSPQRFFHSPSTGSCRTPESVVAALQARERAGLPMSEPAIILDWSGLRHDAQTHFGSLSKACHAAGISRRERSFASRHYKQAEDLVARLKHWHDDGRSLYPVDLLNDREGRIIHKWARRYFGDYQKALEAAGLEGTGRKSHSFPERVRYPDAASVLEGIRARERAGLSLNRNAVLGLRENGGDRTLVLAGSREFGTWEAAVFEAGFYDVDHRPDQPTRTRFWTKRDVVEALRARPPSPSGIKSGSGGIDKHLARAIPRFFASEREALVAAGLLSRRQAGSPPYRNRGEMLAALRQRAGRGQSLELRDMVGGRRGDRPLAEAAHAEFGSWQAVLAALAKETPTRDPLR